MTRHGSLLLELVIALGILTGSAITISSVVIRSARMIEDGRLGVEASDLAGSALTLIQIGTISPEAVDRLSETELRGLIEDTDPNLSVAVSRFEIVVETEPTSWRELTRVTVSVSMSGSERQIAASHGLVNLGRIRSSASGGLRSLGDVGGAP